MILTILTTIILIAIFSITVINLIKKNNNYYIYLLIIEFIGILIDFISILVGKKINMLSYFIIYLVSIIIPIFILYLEKKDIKIGEIISIIKIHFNKEDEKNILIDMIEKYPNSYIGHKRLAYYYDKNSDKEKAEDEYIKAIQIKSNDYKMYIKLANILYENTKQEEAINLLQNLIKNNPSCYEGSMLLGRILYETEQFKEALIVYNEALKYNPSEYNIYYELGMTYTRLNDFENAKEYYKKAATLNSLKDVSNLNLGQINMIFRDYEKSEKYFFETINSDDEKISSYSYYYLAKIRLIQKNENQAIQYANLALEINPSIIRKMEKDDMFLLIIGKLKLVKEKSIKTKLSDKENEIVDYLGKTYNVVEKLTDNMKSEDINKEREI